MEVSYSACISSRTRATDMARRVLLAFDLRHAAWENLIKLALHENVRAGEEPPNLDIARDEDEALRKISDANQSGSPYHCVAAWNELALRLGASIETDGGARLAEAARRGGFAGELFVLVPRLSPELQRRLSGLKIEQAVLDSSFPRWFADRINAGSEQDPVLEVTIEPKSDVREWGYILRGVNFPFKPMSGSIAIGPATYRVLHQLSKELDEEIGDDWQEKLRSLGGFIAQELFDARHGPLGTHLVEGMRKAGGLRNTIVRFVVEKNLYPIAFETIHEPERHMDHWMLHAPVYRRLGAETGQPTVFSDGFRKRDVLILCADTHGLVKDIPGAPSLALEPVKAVRRECTKLKKFFEKNRAAFALGTVRLIPERPSEHLTPSLLNDALKQSWDIVHYAGHAHYDGAEGYLFATQDTKAKPHPTAIAIKDVAPFLVNTGLIYLSSCESLTTEFAFELASRKVPAVLGFRCSVKDNPAREHAESFYRYLFESRSVERAFFNTRREMHTKFRSSDRIWAAAMLVLGG